MQQEINTPTVLTYTTSPDLSPTEQAMLICEQAASELKMTPDKRKRLMIKCRAYTIAYLAYLNSSRVNYMQDVLFEIDKILNPRKPYAEFKN